MKVWQFYWDAGGYGRGVMLVAADDIDEATEIAKADNRNWYPDSQIGLLEFKGTTPQIIVEEHYQE